MNGEPSETFSTLQQNVEQLRGLNVVRVTWVDEGNRRQLLSKHISDRRLQTLFVLEIANCPLSCGFPLITEADRVVAVEAGVSIEDIENGVLSSGYCYPPTSSCACTGSYGGSSCSATCASVTPSGETACNALAGCAWCATTGVCLTSTTENVVARTQDEIDVCPSCAELSGLEPDCLSAPACKYCSSTRACSDSGDMSVVCPFSVVDSSPKDGETDVALTRETILSFSDAVARMTVNSTTVVVESQGSVLDAVLYLSTTNSTLTIFYTSDLPPNSVVSVRVTSDLTSSGESPLAPFQMTFTTLGLLAVPNTFVCGRVFASGLQTLPNGTALADVPLQDVVVSVDGAESTLNTASGSDGAFILGPVPSGTFFVHIDGRTSPKGEQIGGPGAYFPFVGKSWTAVAGSMTNVGTIYLPLIAPGTLTALSDTQTTEVGFPASVLAENPNFSGVRLVVPPGALINPADPSSGSQVRSVGIAPVEPDRLPGPLPAGLNFPVVITIQTEGGENFDQPVPVCFPNLPDPTTNETLLPGDTTALWSFNHDTGRFEIVGPATINDDGSLACSDGGFGILAPGWHGISPGSPADKDQDDEECESGDPCCSGSPTTGPPENGLLGGVYDGLNGGNLVFGCLQTIAKNVASKWTDRVKCGTALYNLGAGVVFNQFNGRPANGREVFDRVNSYQGNKWGAIRDCTGLGTILSAVAPQFAAGLDLTMGIYKCARNLMGAFDLFCKNSELDCDGNVKPLCDANKRLDGILKNVDSVIGFAEAINLIRQRRLSSLNPAVTDEEVERFATDEFFDDAAQYARLNVQAIVDSIDAFEIRFQAGASDSELLAMYDRLERDMEVLRSFMKTAVLDLDGPVQQLMSQNEEMFDIVDSIARAAPSTGAAVQPQELYLYIRTAADDEFRVKTTPSGSIVGLTLPSNTDFFYYAYSVQNNLFGHADGTTSRNGVPTILPGLSLMPVTDSLLVDSDNDGLCDMCEFTIGTDPDSADSDGDGTGDLQELLAGTNPLDGLAITTGVVGIVPLVSSQGTPTSVQIAGSTVFVAMSGGGIAVYNAFNALQPTLVGLIGQEHTFTDVEGGEGQVLGRTTDNRVLLFFGTDFDMMTDATSLYPRLLGASISSIHLGSEFCLLGTAEGRVLIFQSDFSTHVQTIDTRIPSAVSQVVFSPAGLIVCTVGSTMAFFEQDARGVGLWSEFPGSSTALQSTSRNRELQVGTTTAYSMTFEGELDAISLASAATIGSSRALPVPTLDFAVTEAGGGNAVALSITAVDVWDFANAAAPRFVSSFPISGIPREPVLAAGNGFVYVGTSQGLVIVNTNSPDVAGMAPVISRLVVLDRGVEVPNNSSVLERRVLNVYVDVQDDVAIQNVLFFVNSVQVKLDSSFPHSVSVIVPSLSESVVLNVSATAWDTAGNMADEVLISLSVVADTVSPEAISSFPADNSTIAFEASEAQLEMVVSFSESINGTVKQEMFVVERVAPDSFQLNTSAFAFFSNPGIGEASIWVPLSNVVVGEYRMVVGAGFVYDLSGNPSTPYTAHFNVTTASNIRTAVSVIDESNDPQSFVDSRWAEFREQFPDRPFCLLRPLGTFGFLNIPVGFDGIYRNVSRDNGDPAIRSDWFSICRLNEVDQLIRKVGLFVDTSGSMTRATVQASLDLFLERVEEANMEIVQVFNNRERWIDPFFTDLA